MDSNYKPYDYLASFGRIDGILAQPQGNYEEVNSLPDRDALTFTNGFYANCSAIFVDIRDSSKLPAHYRRPALAKLYRAYLSELVAIFNSQLNTREINIAGDAAWAVVNTPYKADIDAVFALAFQANSLIKVLNYKLRKAGYDHPLRVGIGASWGRALMIKAGYSGSGINDVVYMGDVVNEAAHLAAQGSSRHGAPAIMVSDDFYGNLNDQNKGLLRRDCNRGCYSGDVVSTVMEQWYLDNCH